MKRKSSGRKVLHLFGEGREPCRVSVPTVPETEEELLRGNHKRENLLDAGWLDDDAAGLFDIVPDPAGWGMGTSVLETGCEEIENSGISSVLFHSGGESPESGNPPLPTEATVQDAQTKGTDSVISRTTGDGVGTLSSRELSGVAQVVRLFDREGAHYVRGSKTKASDSGTDTAAYWHLPGQDDSRPDLDALLELISEPDASPHSSFFKRPEGPILSYPTLDRVLGRLATAVSRRLYALTTRRWVVIPKTAKRVRFSAWSRYVRPVASSFNMYPLEGVALMGADSDLVQLLTARLLDRGPERCFAEGRCPDGLQQGDCDPLSTASQAVAAHCMHVFQLDLEWALAPFFEVETTRGRVILPDEPIVEFGENEECVLGSFSVSDGEHTGRYMLLFSAEMLRPLEMLLASNSKMLMPASTETDDEVFLRLRTLSDETLTETLAQSHPLLASVVLYRMSEARRLRILQGMHPELQEELVRRMGRRASVLRTLSLEQRVAARCLLMGEGYTSHILRMCTPEAAVRFLGTVATLPSMFPSQAAELCGEENPGLTCGSTLVVDKGTITRLLMRSFSSETFVLVSRLLAEGSHALPFDNLALCTPEYIAALLMHETYGVGGLVLRHLLRKSSELAAAAFALLDGRAKPAILERVIMPRSVDVDIVHTVENALCEHVPLACKAVEPSGEPSQSACSGASGCFSDARMLMSGMDAQARAELVALMEHRGIPMPSDCLKN